MLPSLLLLLRVFGVEKKMAAEKQHRSSNRKMIMNFVIFMFKIPNVKRRMMRPRIFLNKLLSTIDLLCVLEPI